MKKPQEPQIDLEAEYRRLSENEKNYHNKISLWNKLGKITLYLFFASIVLILIAYNLLPENVRQTATPFHELFPYYPLQVSLTVIGFGLIMFSITANYYASNKTDKIRDELGLDREERLYLRAYETYRNINSYMNETKPSRKLFLKKSALENAEKMNKIINGWNYGNIGLIRELMGDQIDLFKDNFRRLVLSNIAEGDETALEKITEILSKFCKYIHSPSIEEFNELNGLISGLKYRKYKVLTRQERIGEYFHSRPRASRLLFASTTTSIVGVAMFCLGQNIGLIIAVSVTCFWGSFSGFEKIFRLKEK